ncbi:MAG TPA: hypothetical protein VFV71_08910 [Burkholderiales bacterium]|nr:hypothetical protein [Burkholderiales bacterium]
MATIRLEAAALLLAGLLACAPAGAQLNQSIADEELYDPWIRAQAAVDSLGGVAAQDEARAQADARTLDDALATLHARLEDVAIRIVARPEFAYDAAQASFDMSREVAQVSAGLDALLADFPPGAARGAEARAALDKLQATLERRVAFERDVLGAIGSGSKVAIQALSARWWAASEHVEALRTKVAAQHR